MRSVLAIVCMALSCVALEAGSSKEHQDKKEYLTEKIVKYNSKGFVVSTKAASFIVKAIRHDRKGLYILGSDVVIAVKGHGHDHGWSDTSCRRDHENRDEIMAYGSQRGGYRCSHGLPYDRAEYAPEQDRYGR